MKTDDLQAHSAWMRCVLVDLLFSLLLLHREELHGRDGMLSSDQEYYTREEQLQYNMSRLGCKALCACRSALFTTFTYRWEL